MLLFLTFNDFLYNSGGLINNNEEEGEEEDEVQIIGKDGVGIKRKRELTKNKIKNKSKINLKDKKSKL